MLNQLRYMPPLREIFSQYGNRVHASRMERAFYRKVPVLIEKGNFLVKTIDSGAELKEVLKLRYQVFHKEYRQKKFPFGLDVEALDPVADHLVIIDKRTECIVGTYRLISSDLSKKFYSESEFRIDGFFSLPGIKLELSRACIHRDHRKGVVINLLWRGLVEYARKVGAKYLFGCSSVKSTDPNQIAKVTAYLKEEGHVSEIFNAVPLAEYQMGFVPTLIPLLEEDTDVKTLIPPLLQSYLRAGAKLAPIPAIDRDFHCADYFTVLDMQNLSRLYERKYL